MCIFKEFHNIKSANASIIPINSSDKYRTIVECAFLLIIASVLRIWFVGKTDLGFDESFSLHMALQNPLDIVHMMCKGDNPPLWELLLHYWIGIFGLSEIAIRSLSTIFSVLTIIPIYLLGERYIQRFAGLSASLIYCFSTFSIYLAHECRIYCLIGFCTACSAFLFISIIKNPITSKFILLTIANLMLLYGHYLSVWIIVMEFIMVMCIKSIRIKIWKPYLIHVSVLLVLFTPMIPVLLARFLDSGLHGTWIDKTTNIAALYNFLWRMCNVPVTTVLSIGIMITALVKLIVSLFKKEAHFGISSILSLLWIVPLLVSFTLSFFTGFFLDRYFYFLFPIFYISIIAYCIYIFPKQEILRLSFMGIIVFAVAVSCSPDSSTKRFSGWHSNIKPIVKQIVKAKESEKTLVMIPEYFDRQFTYYLDDKHEAFHMYSQANTYNVYRKYLLEQGYYYDYDYPNIDFSSYNQVVIPYRKNMPINDLNVYLGKVGYHLEKELDEFPYAICYFTR